jgi:hypothetical protein
MQLTNAITNKINDHILIHKEDGKITQPPIIFKTYNKALKAMKKNGGNDGWSNGWFVTTTFALASRAKWAE